MGTNVVSMLGFVVFAGMVSGMGTTIFAASGLLLYVCAIPLMGLFTTSRAMSAKRCS